MLTVLQAMAFAAYAVTTGLYWHEFILQKGYKRRLSHYALITAILFHLAFLIAFVFQVGRIPIGSLSETIGTFIWISAGLYLLFEIKMKEHALGALILSFLLLLSTLAFVRVEEMGTINKILYDVQFELHVFAMLLGYSGFTLAFIASLLHLLLGREIKKRDLGLFFKRLPSLVFFERINSYGINVGLICVSIGFVLGLFNAQKAWEDANILYEPKILALLFTIVIYLYHFLGQRRGTVFGQKSAIISVVGYVLVLFSFLVVSTILPGSHQFN